jgi:hypothetical protein
MLLRGLVVHMVNILKSTFTVEALFPTRAPSAIYRVIGISIKLEPIVT